MKNTIFLTSALALSISLAGCGGNDTKETVLPPEFTGFSQVEANSTYTAKMITYGATFDVVDEAIIADSFSHLEKDLDAVATIETDGSGNIAKVSIQDINTVKIDFTNINSEDPRVSIAATEDKSGNILFVTVSDYQTFGMWGFEDNTVYPGTGSGVVGIFSTGARTNFSDIPTIGDYVSFTGMYFGFGDASGLEAAGGSVSLTANFVAKKIHLTTTEDLGGLLPALTGDLSYSGSNYFSGDLTGVNVTGIAEGYFYGPNADEVGGVMKVLANKSDNFLLSFGAKR